MQKLNFVMNLMDFYLVQNRKENCHHDHIPFVFERKLKYSFLSVGSARTTLSEQSLQSHYGVILFHDILTKIAAIIFVKLPVKMCYFTLIAIISLKVCRCGTEFFSGFNIIHYPRGITCL